ncbi:MAG: 3-oxoacyl-ACP reductase FabG [Chloroflexi bacterium]|nr:MAG: 3-oxoacyl-ACP reductase FabG [Chloroflexota bacterium]TMC32816.1 MAG: 3-oxoacyl-ACP reductase FabG [Chloroflexota bacterium]TMC54547.1 MAG: 3-oxoacyl-ACP reductase FabG [Chloroflexota bacterium]
MSLPLSGRRALVTGSGTGIGHGIARELARQGADVAIHYAHSADGAESLRAEIQEVGRRVAVLPADLSQPRACRRLVDDTVAALGGLEILVNNSGITLTRDPASLTDAEYDELFGVNVRAAYVCSQQAVPHLARRGGAIVNVSSIHGGAGFPGHAAYAATKGALNAFTRALAIDLAPKRIRVNAVAPGLIEVPRYFDMPGYSREQTAARVPWGRMGEPADVARVVAFLVSPAADYVTGQLLYVDGGINARMGLVWEEAEARR